MATTYPAAGERAAGYGSDRGSIIQGIAQSGVDAIVTKALSLETSSRQVHNKSQDLAGSSVFDSFYEPHDEESAAKICANEPFCSTYVAKVVNTKSQDRVENDRTHKSLPPKHNSDSAYDRNTKHLRPLTREIGRSKFEQPNNSRWVEHGLSCVIDRTSSVYVHLCGSGEEQRCS